MANRDVVEYISKERSLTIDIAIKSTQIEDLIKVAGEKDVLKAITGAILMASEYFNVKGEISDSQAVQTASLFMEQFPMETFEDLLICLKNAKIGKYGPVYNRFDGQMVFTWFRLYLDEKYERFEQLKKNEKDDLTAQTMTDYLPFLKNIIKGLDDKMEKNKQKPIRVTSESHFKQFCDIIPSLSDQELKDFLQYYKEQNALTVRNQYIAYIELLENTLRGK